MTKIYIGLCGGRPLRKHCLTTERQELHLACLLPWSQPTCPLNALELVDQYPLAARAVQEEFYNEDGLTGADSVEGAIELQRQLQELFSKGGFQLRKWNSSNPTVIKHILQEIKRTLSSHTIPDPDQYTKTLGIRWNSVMDHFQLTIAELLPLKRH